MLDILVIPTWLNATLERLQSPLSIAKDAEKLSTILSPEDVVFYRLLQKSLILDLTWPVPIFNSLLKIGDVQCVKNLDCESVELEIAINMLALENTDQMSIEKLLCSGQHYTEQQGKHLSFTCKMIDSTTLVVIPKLCKNEVDLVALYEEVFAVLEHTYDHTQITQLPIYKDYVNCVTQKMVY